jgi:hypothetical protein
MAFASSSLVVRQANGHSMVWRSENGCLGGCGIFSVVKGLGKRNSRRLAARFLFSPISLSIFLHAWCWHDVYAQSWRSI